MSYENAARQQLHRRWWLRAVGVMACIVVFITVYALVLPAITMEGNPTCGLAEHEHTEDCYTADGVLICQLEEHTHDAACYAEAEEGELAQPDAEAEDADLVATPVDAEAAGEPVADAEADEPEWFSDFEEAPGLFYAGEPDADLIDSVDTDGANDWQIVSGGYEGNDASNKTLSADGNVRVQKNVIPTDTENEFLVYLSIDVKESFAEFFQIAQYESTTSNNLHGQELGGIYDSMTGNQGVDVTGDPNAGYSNSATFDIYDPSGNLLESGVRLWWSQANNVTFYMKINTSSGVKYILFGTSVKNGQQHKTLQLSEAAYQAVQEQLVNAASLNSVVDVMGDYIDYISTEQVNGTTSVDGKTLNWTPSTKANPEREESTETVDGKEVTTTWYLNVSELVYKVKLDVTKSGFNSAAQNMSSAVGDPESYPTNNSAILNYGDGKTTPFPQPYVRGLLYDVVGTKVDAKTGALLPGAVFTLTPDGTVTATTDANGAFSFTGLPWGDYTVTETAAPKGYKLDEGNTADVTLCYTTDKDVLTVSTADDTHMMASDTDTFKFEDQYNQPTIVLVKHDEGANVLPDASFTISGPADFSLDATSDANGMITTIANAENGEYTVTETQAPDGYNLLSDALTITVDGTDVTAKLGSAAVSDGDLTTAVDPETGITTVTIVIHNNSGAVLPATGGPGTVIFTVSGLALMAAAMILLSKQRKRNHA